MDVNISLTHALLIILVSVIVGGIFVLNGMMGSYRERRRYARYDNYYPEEDYLQRSNFWIIAVLLGAIMLLLLFGGQGRLKSLIDSFTSAETSGLQYGSMSGGSAETKSIKRVATDPNRPYIEEADYNPLAPPTERYYLEMNHFADFHTAKIHLIAWQQALNKPADIYQDKRSGKFRVRIGPFESYKAALKIKQVEQIDAYIISDRQS